MKKYITILSFIASTILFSQSSVVFDGYLQNMQTVWAPKDNSNWIFSNSISNRINLNWYASDNFTFRGSLRNLFDYGDFVKMIPFYSDFATVDNGYFDLTTDVASDLSYLFYSNIDRLNFTYNHNDLEIQIGRQRINWGINSVWTPNDIFNSSSFINFDYAEKPGSDAVRAQYYMDFASSIELVAKLNADEELTLAGKVQLNKWDYDFQFIGGMDNEELVLGAGWTGSISDAGFTGEFTFFENKEQNIDDIFVSSIGANYTFPNSLYLSCEFLYNSIGITGKNINLTNIFNLDYSARSLSPSRYSIFAQASYPITPLINSSVASIINPSDGSFFLSPTTEFSLNEDVYLLIAGQLFFGDNFTEWGNNGQFYYLRIKWNF